MEDREISSHLAPLEAGDLFMDASEKFNHILDEGKEQGKTKRTNTNGQKMTTNSIYFSPVGDGRAG